MTLSLEDEILLLRAQVDYLLERLAEAPELAERPVTWTTLHPAQAGEQWALLIDWTSWLRERYQLHEHIPACWFAHGALVEELSALRSAWVGAYLDPHAALGDPANWHDLLDRTRYRLRAWDRNGCSDGTHRPDLTLPDDTDATLREQALSDDLSRRSEQE
ncbi:MAG: hypothetical protein JWN57_1483 [Frankiales bacterium]|jgi:hypothetical protein|nr:hypothetical protein [Frankiales bacterium]